MCGKKQYTKAEIRSEMSELICGRIAAGENYNLMRDNIFCRLINGMAGFGCYHSDCEEKRLFSMKKLMKKMLWINIYLIVMIFLVQFDLGALKKWYLFINVIYYIFFFIDIITIIYNRREIVEKAKYPVLLLIVNVFIANVILLSIIVWLLSIYHCDSFLGVSKYFEALYFTVVSFSTVGYGDILPISMAAKIITMVIIISNILLLIVFVNFFVMKAKKKDDYLHNIIFEIYFLFSAMSSECGIVDEKYKTEMHSWSEWMDIFADVIQKNADENPERVAEINHLIEKDRDYNSKRKEGEAVKEIPYRYINSKDDLLIKDFVYSSNRIIKAIEFLENNKINLLENENLDKHVFFILDDIKSGFDMASRHYRYGVEEGNNMLRAFKNDLINDLEQLGYIGFNEVKFCGYNAQEDRLLGAAMARINIQDKEEVFWLKIRSVMDVIFKL